MKKYIDSIQRKTNIDVNYVVSGASWLLLLRLVTGTTGFFVTYALTQSISKGAYGEYKYVLSILSLLLVFSLPGINSAITQAVAKKKDIQLLPIAKEQMRWATLGALIGLSIAAYYVIQGNLVLGQAFIVVSCFIPFLEAFLVYPGYISGKQQFRLLAVLQIVLRVVQSVSIIIAALVTKDLVIIFLAYSASQAIITGFLFSYTRRCIGEKQTFSDVPSQDTQSLISYGKHLSLTQVLARVSAEMDNILIWHIYGAATVALYGVARVAIRTVRLFTGFLTELALPRFSQRDMRRPEYTRQLYVKMIMYIVFLIVIYIVYVLVAKFLFSFLFPDYMDAVFISKILGLVIIVAPIRSLYDQLFISTRMVRAIYLYKSVEVGGYLFAFFLLYVVVKDPLYVVALALPLKETLSLIVQFILFHPSRKGV